MWVEGGGVGGTLGVILCLHNSVSCIGILSLRDCNASPLWTVTSALASDFSSIMGGQEATPGEPSWVCGLTGELAFWGGPVEGREPFTRAPPAASERAKLSFPFSSKSDVTGPEKDGKGDAVRKVHLWVKWISLSWQTGSTRLTKSNNCVKKKLLKTLIFKISY